MEYQNIIFEKTSDHIGLLTINRPSAMNALNVATFYELYDLFQNIEKKREVRGLLITGSGRSFVAGADLNECKDAGIEENRSYAALAQSVFSRLAALPIPTIAAINGFALGGGCELGLCCDIRIASTKAKLGQPEVKLGVIPCFGGTQRLSRLIGIARAKELIFTGRTISADEACAMGLVNRVVEPEALLDTALESMKQILNNSPTALKYAKVAIDQGWDMPLDAGLELEKDLSAICYGLPDKEEGMTAFVEKRPPNFGN